MKYNLGAIIAITLALGTSTCVLTAADQQEHFRITKTHPYVLTIFHNGKTNQDLSEHLLKAIELVEKTEVAATHGVVAEFVDTADVPFLDSHYKLEGRRAVKFFINNKMTNFDNFHNELDEMAANSTLEQELPLKLLMFVDLRLKKISEEVRDLDHFRNLLETNKTIGYFCGSEDDIYKQHFKVAAKNIDFKFAHTFNEAQNIIAMASLGSTPTPKCPFFAIIRHADALNEFDTNQIVTFSDFEEKPLTEFIEFERFDRLRNPSTGSEIVKRMFAKAQPLLLYVQNDRSDLQHLSIYKEAVRALPKRFIYSHVDIDSENSTPFFQLFMMADKMMESDSLTILWVGLNRKVQLETFKGAFDKELIMEFVFKFNKNNEKLIKAMRDHLYDKPKVVDDGASTSEEL